jgi:hypothetical protein
VLEREIFKQMPEVIETMTEERLFSAQVRFEA